MTETEKKALALVNEVEGGNWLPHETDRIRNFATICRAIEQHEAFRQEVSDAVEDVDNRLAGDGFLKIVETRRMLAPFIIAKPDPLVEALKDCGFDQNYMVVANNLNAALAARGLEVRKIGEGE